MFSAGGAYPASRAALPGRASMCARPGLPWLLGAGPGRCGWRFIAGVARNTAPAERASGQSGALATDGAGASGRGALDGEGAGCLPRAPVAGRTGAAPGQRGRKLARVVKNTLPQRPKSGKMNRVGAFVSDLTSQQRKGRADAPLKASSRRRLHYEKLQLPSPDAVFHFGGTLSWNIFF